LRGGEQMYNHALYFSYWLVNAFVIYLAAKIFPNSVVLGTWKFSSVEAAIYSSFWLTILIWTTWDFVFSKVKKVNFNGNLLSIFYFWMMNGLSVWLVARFSQYTGLGIDSWLWAAILGGIAYIFQRFTWGLVTRNQLGKI